jgi:hypothetical protein
MQDPQEAAALNQLGLTDDESTVMTNDGLVNRDDTLDAAGTSDDEHDDTYHDEQAEADIAAAAAAAAAGAAAGDTGSNAAAGSSGGSSVESGWVPRVLEAPLPKHPASKGSGWG